MKAGGQVRDSSGRRGVGQDAARAWRGKDIGECRFKGTAAGQLSTDRPVRRDEWEQEELQAHEAAALRCARRTHQPESQLD